MENVGPILGAKKYCGTNKPKSNQIKRKQTISPNSDSYNS